MNNLAIYYCEIKKDYEKAEKYYLMVIDEGNIRAIYNLAVYYYKKTDYEQMEKYYLIAIEKDYVEAMKNLEKFYVKKIYMHDKIFKLFALYSKFPNKIDNVDRKNVILVIKHLWQGKINKDQKIKFIKLLLNYDFKENDCLPSSLKIFMNIIKNNLNILALHFKYSLNSIGFNDAKKDYISHQYFGSEI